MVINRPGFYATSCTKIEGRNTLETDWDFTVSNLMHSFQSYNHVVLTKQKI